MFSVRVYLLYTYLVVKKRLFRTKATYLHCESWVEISVSDTQIKLPGYNLRGLDRVNKHVPLSGKSIKLNGYLYISYISESGLRQPWLKLQVRNLK